MYGRLNDEQRQALKPFISGKVVYDYGAGDCSLSEELLDLGAEHVHALDKHFPRVIEDNPNLTQHTTTFCQLLFDSSMHDMDVAFVSWPPNNPSSDEIAAFVSRSKTTIYLGSNFDGSACGTYNLFLVMHCCELLGYVPSFKNNLLITGKMLDDPRDLTPEEVAGLTMDGITPIISWEEAHKPGGALGLNDKLVLRKIP